MKNKQRTFLNDFTALGVNRITRKQWIGHIVEEIGTTLVIEGIALITFDRLFVTQIPWLPC